MRPCLTFLAAPLALLLGLLSAQTAAQENHDIDLKLFGEDVIQGWEGCRLAFWQHNRDPGEDRYAYVFFAPVPDGEALPGWIKIGDGIIEVSKQDTGSADTGMLEPFQLYRDADRKLTLLVEINEQSRSERGIEIHDARLTFLRNDKYPFPIRVRGLNGCPGMPDSAAEEVMADSGSGGGLTLGQPVDFDSLDQVPAPILRAIADQAPECEPSATPGFSSAFAVNDDITLWQLPCNLYASRGSSVFALSWTYYPDHATILMNPPVPGSGGAESAEILDAIVDPESGTVTSISLDSGGDCGSYTLLELEDAEGETLEFTLREFREKSECDGVETDPADFPLVYRNP
ncbi:MAG: hypothetical protein RIC18_00935 [Hoeflea sp.]|uniref:hypothetical protein n=1 Tax=Hoeflea sp. TaxID=1940281 RepID=UPI0032EEEF03